MFNFLCLISMCLYPRTVAHYGHDGRIDGYNVFPCGHCSDCIKRKQNDYIQRMCLAAVERPRLWFFTFTFNNKTIPLLCKPLDIDEQYNYSSKYDDLLESQINAEYLDEDDSLRQSWIDNCPRKGKIQFNRPYVYQDQDGIRYSVMASLCNRSVQLVFKQFREHYRRKRVKLDWKFIVAGEYGSIGSRPHYHGAIFGLDRDQASCLARFWRERYGLCTFDLIPVVSSDGRNHQEFVARYVAKYLVKGSYEDPFVKAGYVVKPRVLVSSNLNTFSSEFRSWYSGEDLFSSPDLPVVDYKDADLDRLIARHKFTVGSHTYNLAKSFKNKLFYKKERIEQLNGSFKLFYTPTNLSKALSLRVQSRALESSVRKFESTTGYSLEDSPLEVCQSFQDMQILDKLSTAQKALALQKICYQKSKF